MTETFAIAPASSRYLWFLIPFGLVMLTAFAVVFASTRGARNASFQVRHDGLELRGDLYGRFIPTSELRIGEARRLNLSEEPQFRPRWRQVGTALPGYRAGWFRLANNEKALLYLTDPNRAVHIPTTNDFSVIVSPQSPERFLASLRKLAE